MVVGENHTLGAVKDFKGGLNLAPTTDKTKELSCTGTRDEKDVVKDLWVLGSELQGSDSSKLLGKAVKTLYYCR